MLTRFRPYIIGFVLGLVACTAAWGAWTLWQDHKTLQALVNIENQRQMQQRQGQATSKP